MFVLGVATILALWSWDNQEFIKTANQQLENGFTWESIECREPNKSVPYIALETPDGKELVCHKLTK